MTWWSPSPARTSFSPTCKRSSLRCADILMLPGCGHWTQQERPGEVNAAIIEFLRSLPG